MHIVRVNLKRVNRYPLSEFGICFILIQLCYVAKIKFDYVAEIKVVFIVMTLAFTLNEMGRFGEF